jgi:hypothetical protein
MTTRKRKAPPVSSTLTIDVNGKSHRGSYIVDRPGKLVTVTSEYSHKSAVLYSSSSPELLARILLREMIEEAAQRGWIASSSKRT